MWYFNGECDGADEDVAGSSKNKKQSYKVEEIEQFGH